MQGRARSSSHLKSFELPEGFWQSTFKSQVRHLENELKSCKGGSMGERDRDLE